MSEWISVCERLPADNKLVIIVKKARIRGSQITIANLIGGKWVTPTSNFLVDHVSHWMPLPPMPTGAVEVKGSDSNEHKESSLIGFSDGSIRVLITKPSIAGFGMNWSWFRLNLAMLQPAS